VTKRVARCWVGSFRRDLLDHVMVLNERTWKRLLAEYVCYYHEDRTHQGLARTRLARSAGSAASCRANSPSAPALTRFGPRP
jgi:hypothetical protein